jgi:uncharacterized protein (TIGR04206 family)
MNASGAGPASASPADGESARTRLRRPAALLALAAVPWVVVPADGRLLAVFPWGLATTAPVTVTSLWDYYFVYTDTLPRRLRAWPTATLLHAGALAYALIGTYRPGLEDRRVTGGVVVLAGASNLVVTAGLLRVGAPAFPAGTVLAWAAAWWLYGPDLYGIVGGR